MLFLENCDIRLDRILHKPNAFGTAPYPLIAFAYNLESVANGIDSGSGSGEQPVLRSSPLMRVPEAAISLAAQVSNDIDGSICDKYKDRDRPCLVVCIREMHGSQHLTDVKV
jgi:hypothetical protein